MSTVDRGHSLPLFAVVLGGIGSLCLLFGLLGQFSPGAVSFAPALRESTVSSALVMVGAVFVVIELAAILPWARHRSKQGRRQ